MKTKKLVLIIDDEPELRELIAEFLESFGWETKAAANGLEAVNILESHSNEISVLLTDFSMPKMNGLEFLKETRKRAFLNPVVFFSGFGKEEHLGEAMRLGASDFLEKGFDYYSLLEAVDTAHEKWEKLLKNARLLSGDPEAFVGTEMSVNAKRKDKSLYLVKVEEDHGDENPKESSDNFSS